MQIWTEWHYWRYKTSCMSVDEMYLWFLLSTLPTQNPHQLSMDIHFLGSSPLDNQPNGAPYSSNYMSAFLPLTQFFLGRKKEDSSDIPLSKDGHIVYGLINNWNWYSWCKCVSCLMLIMRPTSFRESRFGILVHIVPTKRICWKESVFVTMMFLLGARLMILL